MTIRSTRDIYRVVEKYLKKSDVPLTCVDLMENREVEDTAMQEFGGDKRHATNKLSDTLGFMWRRGVLTRYPASGDRTQMARFGYKWSEQEEAPPKPLKSVPQPRSLSKKTGVVVTEQDDGVVIEFDKFTVVIKPK